MANDDPNLIKCRLCGSKGSLECKRGFLGFAKCYCSSCGKHFERRLNSGYRATYWLLGIWTTFVLLSKLPLFINALSIGIDLFLNIMAEYSLFILFAVGSFLALKKDFKLKSEITKEATNETEQSKSADPSWEPETSETTKPVWKLGTIGFILVIIFAGVIGKYIGRSATESFVGERNENELNSALIKAANELNRNLPMMVDSETRLDSTTGMNKQARFYYTLINYRFDEIDSDAFKSYMQPQLLNKVCTTNETKFFFDNDVPVTFAYYDKEGNLFTTITVQSFQCNGS